LAIIIKYFSKDGRSVRKTFLTFRFLLGTGFLLIGGSLAGKASLKFYKAVKAGNAFASSPASLG